MPSISLPAAIGLSAAAGVGSAVIGSNAAQSAAKTQAAAANQASQNQMDQFHQTQANLAPFVSSGQGALGALNDLTGTNPGGNPLTAALTAQFQPTMAQLSATPGYQFTLGQGQLANQNSYAAQGLGASGAAMKGGINYAEGLAGTTYQQQFQNYLAGNQQTYGMLSGLTNLGENAAAMTGQQGLQATTAANQYLTSGAAASAAGTVGSANALMGGLNSTTSNLTNYAMMNSMGMFGNAAGPAASNAYAGYNVTGLPGNALGVA